MYLKMNVYYKLMYIKNKCILKLKYLKINVF